MLKFIDASKIETLKVTIQKSGKLGFSMSTARRLSISGKFVRFAKDENDNMYFQVSDKSGSDAYKVCKGGEYFYLKTESLFDYVGIPFRDGIVIYDLEYCSEYDAYLMKYRKAKTRREHGYK